MRLVLWGLVVWTVLGLFGTAVAARRSERGRARRGLLTLLAAWVLYVAALLLTSVEQPARTLPPRQERYFGNMSFAVVRTEEIQGFWARGQERERLVRVSIQVANHDRDRTDHEGDLHASLLDAQGRHWAEVPGLSGVRLSGPVAAGGSTLSTPVFRVARDATDLALVLTHGPTYSGRLVIGDPESLLHRPTLMPLPPP